MERTEELVAAERVTEPEWNAWMTMSWEDWLARFCVVLYRLKGVRVWQVPRDGISLRSMWQEGADADAAACKTLWMMGYDVYFGEGEAFDD